MGRLALSGGANPDGNKLMRRIFTIVALIALFIAHSVYAQTTRLVESAVAVTDIPLAVKGAAGQTGNLFEARNSVSSPLLYVSSIGALKLGGNASDPAGTNGLIYYDTGTDKFRCYQNGAWIDCVTPGGTTYTGTPPIVVTGSVITCLAASAGTNGCLSAADYTSFNSKVSTTRAINTTSPLAGGGNLSADRTLTCTTCGVTGSPLSQFASTTSLQLAGVISDETGGSGLAVFNSSPVIITPNFTTGFTIGGAAASGNVARGNGTNFVSSALAAADLSNGTTGSGGGVVLATAPTISAPVISGHPTVEGVTSTGATGTGKFVFDASPTVSNLTVTGSCTGCGGASSITDFVPTVSQTFVVSAGLPVSIGLGTSGPAIGLPFAADSSVTQSTFTLSGRTTSSSTITPVFTLKADSAPGATNNKLTIKIACNPNGAGSSYTSSDTYTLANNATQQTFTATNAVCTSRSANDTLNPVVYRVTGGANDMQVQADLMSVDWKFTATQ